MSYSTQFLFLLEVLIFASVIFMHLAKKSFSVVFLYALQSLVVTVLLLSQALKEPTFNLIAVIVIIFIIKVVVAPLFFYHRIRRHQLKFSASTYLNSPLTLIIAAVLTAFTYSHLLKPLTIIAPENGDAILLAVATMLIAVFLIMNRKGILSQMLGILSLENAIVSFASLANLEQTPGLQLGIIFDIFIWVLIATVFVSLIYKQFASLDVTAMQHLKEE